MLGLHVTPSHSQQSGTFHDDKIPVLSFTMFALNLTSAALSTAEHCGSAAALIRFSVEQMMISVNEKMEERIERSI